MIKKKLLLVTLLSLVFAATCFSQSRRERKILYNSSYNYEIQPIGVGQDGTRAVKVWGYGRNAEDAVQAAKRNAVAACIFAGVPAGPGVGATPAIVSDRNAHETHADFFEEFFEVGGRYLQFITLSTDGPPSGQDRIRIRRNYYKVGISVQVMYNNLRSEMESAGIARRLDHGF